MVPTVAAAIRALEKQSRDDPDLAEAVVLLAQGTEDGDPFGVPPKATRRAAQLVNARRIRARRGNSDGLALETSEVVALLRSVNDRRGASIAGGVEASFSDGSPGRARFIRSGSSTRHKESPGPDSPPCSRCSETLRQTRISPTAS